MTRWCVHRLDGSVVALNVTLADAFAVIRGELARDKAVRFTCTRGAA